MARKPTPQDYGIDMTGAALGERIDRVWKQYRDAKSLEHRSTDELLVHPADAIAFCDYVRAYIDSRLPDDLILRSLIAYRKRGAAKNKPSE